MASHIRSPPEVRACVPDRSISPGPAHDIDGRPTRGLAVRSGPRLSAQTHRPQLTQNGEPGPVVTTEGPPLDATYNGAAPRNGIPHLGTEPTAISQPRPSFRRR